MTLLLTGAGGYLASHLVPALLRHRPGKSIYLLFRAGSRAELDGRVDALLGYVRASPEIADRIIPIAGDITRSDLGLGDAFRMVAEAVEEVFHLAANTRIDGSSGELRLANVVGTENVISFCEKVGELRDFSRLHYVSTAYVCGNRTGRILESELDCGQTFANSYERSKFEGEKMVRRHAGLPATVYRPSIVLGDMEQGRSPSFLGFHQIVLGLADAPGGFLGGQPDATVDIIPLDQAAEMIGELSVQQASRGMTFHIASGESAPSAAETVACCSEAIEEWRRERSLPRLAPVTIVPSDYLEGAWAEGVPLPRALRRLLRSAAPYTSRHQLFDTASARSLLRPLTLSGPSRAAYLKRVVRFTLDHALSDRIARRRVAPRPLSQANSG